MSFQGSVNIESRRQPYGPVHTHTQNNTSKSVLCPRLTPPTPQNKLCHIKFGWVSSPVLVSFLCVDLCPLVSTHTDTKPSPILPSSQTPVICNLTRESSRVSLMSNKMCTRTLYTPPILHTLHTRPDISSHMSRTGTLTY